MVLDDPAIVQTYDTMAARRDTGIMRDDDQRQALGVQIGEQCENFLGGAAVQIAGRFIGQQQFRAADQRACDGNPLALAAG